MTGAAQQVPAVLGAAAAPVSLTSISPPEQGDAFCGLSLAVAGVGPAAAPDLPTADWPTAVEGSDAWAVAVGSDTGWYVLLSQDCDIVRSATEEPTLLIAPLVRVTKDEWNQLDRNGYSSRRWAYPTSKFTGLAQDDALAVDLAWTTSVLRGSILAPGVTAQRPLTGPQKRDFAEWVAARTGRAPFADDIVVNVLDPCFEVRKRLAKSFDQSAANANLESRAVGAAVRWFARVQGRNVTIFGQLTSNSLSKAGFLEVDGTVKKDDLDKGVKRLEAAVVAKMNKVDSSSGFQVKIHLADLDQVKASSFVNFSLLLR